MAFAAEIRQIFGAQRPKPAHSGVCGVARTHRRNMAFRIAVAPFTLNALAHRTQSQFAFRHRVRSMTVKTLSRFRLGRKPAGRLIQITGGNVLRPIVRSNPLSAE